jgi:squalene-hopene/tetraprenyl-beta-curcumene cyclase
MSMAKTLKVLGLETVDEPDRDLKHDWRKDIVFALRERQEEDGSWVNDNAAWQENSPVLCTAYALEALRNTTK